MGDHTVASIPMLSVGLLARSKYTLSPTTVQANLAHNYYNENLLLHHLFQTS